MLSRNSRLAFGFLLAVLGAGVFAVYAPGLNGPFVFDDYPNIINNPLVAIDALDGARLRDAAFSIGNRPYPHRGIARVSFALNYYFAGRSFDSFAFKVTNVVIHVLNGLLVYWLSVLLLRRYAVVARAPSAQAGWSAMQSYLPLLVTALWLLHPIQLTSVLYVVQRMTSMAAFFVFSGLVAFVLGRMRLESGRPHGMTLMFAGLGAGVVLGYLCKQNAVLLPFFAFLVELFFFRHQELPKAARRRLYGFYALTVGLPALLAVGGLIFGWETIAKGYLFRDFTPWERLLTQSRVLFFYLGLLAFPHIRSFGLYHDDIALSTGLLTPWTTLVSVVAWLVLIVLALWGVRRRAIWSFGLLWYLVGHSLESSVIALELVFEHRNYVPSYGVLFAAAFYLVWGLERVSSTRRVALPVIGLLVAVLAFTTFTRAGIWGDKITWNLFTAKNHPESYRSLNAGMFNKLGREDVRDIFAGFARAAAARKTTIVPLVEMMKVSVGLRNFIGDQGGSETEESSSLEGMELLQQPLILSPSYLDRVASTVDAMIKHRLETYPVIAESAYALDRVHTCYVQRVDVCLPLRDKLLEWYVPALANPRMNNTVRGMLLMNRAVLHEEMGELGRAAALMREAAVLDPNNLSYPLTLAKFYIRHQQWAEAKTLLDKLQAEEPWSGFGSRHVSYLRKQYEDRMKASGMRVQ